MNEQQQQQNIPGPSAVEILVGRIAEAWRARQQRRYWTAERQLENLRQMVYSDHRWLAHDKVADALTTRYVAALAPDWHQREHTDACIFRREIGLEPQHCLSAFGGHEHMRRLERWVRGEAPYNKKPAATED